MTEDGGDRDPTADRDTVQEILNERLDGTDFGIIRALNEDGRMSDTDLADRVGLSRTAARRRRRKLQEEGVLEVMAVIVLQEADLAYGDVRVALDPDASEGERAVLIDRLLDEQLVYSIDSCLGEYDLFVRAWHADLDALKSYVREGFAGVECVASYDMTPVIKTWKAWDNALERPEVE